MSEDTYELSMDIASDMGYFSDRWNPERLGRIEEKMKKLEKRLRETMTYSKTEWDKRKIEV